MKTKLVMLLLLLPLLAACATPAAAVDEEAMAPPPMTSGEPAQARVDDAVDHSCRVDADCAVKDVGNCCGYYPACVNVDSPTFPEQVQARCAESGMMGVCGFAEISSCQCVESRCEPAGGAGAQPFRIEIE